MFSTFSQCENLVCMLIFLFNFPILIYENYLKLYHTTIDNCFNKIGINYECLICKINVSTFFKAGILVGFATSLTFLEAYCTIKQSYCGIQAVFSGMFRHFSWG